MYAFYELDREIWSGVLTDWEKNVVATNSLLVLGIAASCIVKSLTQNTLFLTA